MLKIITFSLILLFSVNNSIFKNKKNIPRVPDWSKTAVWYQIFPERFTNGDTTNDPTPYDMQGAWPYIIPNGWKISPWTSDWFKLQPWEISTKQNFYWNSGVRRYGGDLQGVINKLSYLKKLGVTAIYFNPVFESPSLHKYDTKMYRHIDNNFGPNPNKDEIIWNLENPYDENTWKWSYADSLFLKLIKLSHQQGFKIIIDGVFNHVGINFWAFKDVIDHQQQSIYKDWFIINSWDNPKTEKNEFDYQGWYGIKELPEIKKDSIIGLAPGFANHIKKILKRWMDPNNDGVPNDGIDGWRLDVAERVDIKFWKIFRSWVKEINPDAYITGEIWWKDWNKNQMFNASPWLQGNSFDGIMNYKFARSVKKFIADQKEQISPRAFADSIEVLIRDYPKDNFYALQNLLDSHDVDRIASQIVNPDRWYDHYASAKDNNNYIVRKPNSIEISKQKLAVGIQMTMPGAPMIYYGDEAGMWGGDDPDCRRPMIWENLQYEPETSDPLERSHSVDSVNFNQDLFNWYHKLITIRKNNTELSLGDIFFFYTNSLNNVLGYKRTYNNKSIYILLNNSNNDVTLNLDLSKEGLFNKNLKNLLTKKDIRITGNFSPIFLAPYEIVILK
ncbi:MAG: alpha-amylase [Ignavibacteriales bacterium CG_4_9_14_3_um_filter_30_11]|nr:MAG: alpha-amylase [Ignavibacteriales bacterium CG_4_9_14_3_um_filter_30_11]